MPRVFVQEGKVPLKGTGNVLRSLYQYLVLNMETIECVKVAQNDNVIVKEGLFDVLPW